MSGQNERELALEQREQALKQREYRIEMGLPRLSAREQAEADLASMKAERDNALAEVNRLKAALTKPATAPPAPAPAAKPPKPPTTYAELVAAYNAIKDPVERGEFYAAHRSEFLGVSAPGSSKAMTRGEAIVAYSAIQDPMERGRFYEAHKAEMIGQN